MSSPVFVAVFADRETVRMSCWHKKGRDILDLHRGLALARAAYASRMRTLAEAAIVKAHFEDTARGVLAKYDESEIREATAA